MKRSILAAALLAVSPVVAQADTVRPAVGKPLQQAEALIQRHDYNAALKKIDQANAAGNLTPFEAVVVAQVQGIAAAGAGDYTQAAGAYETVLKSGTVPSATATQYIQAIAGFYYQAAKYPLTVTWVNRYVTAGGSDPRTRALLAQAYYQEGDFAEAEKALWQEQKAAKITGQALPESELQLLASSAQKAGDQAGYEVALDALLTSHPNPQYWAQAIALVTASPDFPDRLTLDVYRLRLATGALTAPGDYEDYTERAILAGAPGEANTVITKGFASGILTEQTDVGHAARLRTLAAKDSAAKPDQPAVFIEQAQAKGGLDLGIAYYQAGQNDQALQAFHQASAGPLTDPAAQLARLWAIQAATK